MDESNIADRLNELAEIFEDPANSPPYKLAKSTNPVQANLNYLRLCIKYQTFDLEATRRENEYLKKLLEE